MVKRKHKEVETAPEEVVVPTEGDKGTISVYSKGGEFIRTFSKEAHGNDYKKLASGYAGKIGGTVK